MSLVEIHTFSKQPNIMSIRKEKPQLYVDTVKYIQESLFFNEKEAELLLKPPDTHLTLDEIICEEKNLNGCRIPKNLQENSNYQFPDPQSRYIQNIIHQMSNYLRKYNNNINDIFISLQSISNENF